jgi:hypothetical protein
MQFLKQSTAASVIVGPVLDADGNAYTSAVIGDFNLTKNGTTAALAAAATATHSHNGNYIIALTTGNTDTLGRLAISMNKATYGMTIFRYDVLTAAAFDAIVANGNVSTFGGGAVASVTSPVTVGTNNDKAGYSLTTAERTAIADRDFSALTAGPSTGGSWPNGSFGERLLIGDTTARAVKVTGAGHAAADVHEFQPDVIDSDAIATSAITEIAGGVWSAASSAYSAATGTMGLIMYAFSQMLENVSGWRWKATALSQAPAGGGSGVVNVLPAVGISAERQAGVVLSPFVGETITQSITLYATDGTTPINLSGKTLEIVFQTRSGSDVAVIANANITVSGTSNNIVTFAYPAAVTSSERTLRVSLRDNAAPRTVYLSGLCKVSIAPSVDA